MKNIRVSFVAMIMVAIVIFQACKKKDEGNNPTPVVPPAPAPAPAPVLTLDAKDFTASLDENPENGKVLGTLDAHKSESAVYTLANESVIGPIEINTKGEVLVKNKYAFDFEANPTITADYIVKDGEAEGKGKITISINNIKEPFIMTVHTFLENGKHVIIIPTMTNEVYNYEVDWGDGTVESGLQSDKKHFYSREGTYTIKIRGTFPAIQFGSSKWAIIENVASQVISIDAWGDNKWKSMNSAFKFCEQMNITAQDSPVLTECNDAYSMFYYCKMLNADLSKWDVSNIKYMNAMFFNTYAFEGDLTGWDVGKVTHCKCFARDSKMTKKPNLTCDATCDL